MLLIYTGILQKLLIYTKTSESTYIHVLHASKAWHNTLNMRHFCQVFFSIPPAF